MLDAQAEMMLVQVEQGLQEIGYSGDLLRRDYAFADLLGASDSVRLIPLAAFAQEPPSYRSACLGVLVGAPGVDVSDYRALGAPQLLELDEREARRWKVTIDEPQILQRILPLDARRVFEPFAGHAAFLIAALGRLRALLPAGTTAAERHDYFVRMLTGMEIDSFAREVARLSLMLADYPNPAAARRARIGHLYGYLLCSASGGLWMA